MSSFLLSSSGPMTSVVISTFSLSTLSNQRMSSVSAVHTKSSVYHHDNFTFWMFFWRLTFPSGPRLSTQVGSDQHSPRGTRMMTGRSRCGAQFSLLIRTRAISLVPAYVLHRVGQGTLSHTKSFNRVFTHILYIGTPLRTLTYVYYVLTLRVKSSVDFGRD